MTIRGLCAFPITPADGDGTVDAEALQRLLSRLVAAGVDSIGLLGSTGSYAYLSRAQRRRAIAAAVECVAGRVPLLVGVGALRTDAAAALARDALEAGAQVGLLAPVSYTPLLEQEVYEHFRAVSESGLPLCIYNNPSTTHFAFSPELIGRLASLPGVVAVKTPAPAAHDAAALHAALRALVPPDFSVGFSVDWNAAEALLAGGDAWYSVLAGIDPAAALRLARAAQSGDAGEVRRLNAQLAPLWQLFRTHGSYRVAHLAAALAGIPHAQPPRPVLPLSGEAAGEVERVLGARETTRSV
jgi:4-hydroxy-tetrahydrodipicolinate synthase